MNELPRLAELRGLPRAFLTAFLVTLTLGYLTGIYFVDYTTHGTPEGIVQQFRGNEDLPMEAVQAIKYPKSDREMLNIIHAHVTSFALIFFGAGGVFLLSGVRRSWKWFLAVEPFVATLVLFGSMAAVRYLPASWAFPMAVLMMLAGLTTFLALLLMVSISLYELWAGRTPRWLAEPATTLRG